jgi:hypothetical protein
MLPPTGVFGKANASEERKPNGARIETNIDYRPARRLNEVRKAERNEILGSSIPHLPAVHRPGQVLHRLDVAAVAGVGVAAQIPAVFNCGQH